METITISVLNAVTFGLHEAIVIAVLDRELAKAPLTVISSPVLGDSTKDSIRVEWGIHIPFLLNTGVSKALRRLVNVGVVTVDQERSGDYFAIDYGALLRATGQKEP